MANTTVKTAGRSILHLKHKPASRPTFHLRRRYRAALRAHEFIGRVQARAPGHERDKARAATHATLEALGQYLSAEQVRRMTARLPRELAESARRSAGCGGPADLDLFYAQIAGKAHLQPEAAVDYAHAVTSVLRQTVPEGALADAMLHLPRELDELVA
jgi:uncharacterized protein (DUF2267 family)